MTEIAAERDKHIRILKLRYVYGYSVAHLCRLYECSASSVRRWIGLAESYPDERVAAIRAKLHRN